jgi:fatty-acyl-CoA synthase
MEIPLTPMEFARRARRLYANREAVVDGELRLTYAQFFERCDRWSAVLQAMGVRKGDRVAYIAPNTHAHLEAYYAVPQIGAVLVPINYRLLPDDFDYIINHCGAKVLCAHSDYIEAVEGIRPKLKCVEYFVALEGASTGWINYETALTEHGPEFEKPDIAESDLLTINYTSGTTARPKGVMITHRNAYLNVMGTLVHHHLMPADRYLWTLPMFHANGWTFTWINTARGMTHVCLRRVEPKMIYQMIKDERITMLCAAPTVLISIANAPAEMRAGAPRGVRLFTAGAPPAAATIELVERELGWELTHVYGLTETSPLITFCERVARASDTVASGAGANQGAPGRRAGQFGRAESGRRARQRGGTRRSDAGRDHGPRQRRHERLLQRPRGNERGDQEQLVPFRRRRSCASRRLRRNPRPLQGHHHFGR